MSFNQFGLGTLNFGAPLITGYITKTATVSYTPNINVMVENESGSIVCRRYDDIITKVSFDGYVNVGSGSLAGAILQPGQEFSITSSAFTGKLICEKFDVKYDGKQFTQFSAEGVTSQYLTLP
jgi:hypothetical protein